MSALPGFHPAIVPELGNFGMVGASQTESGTVIRTLVPNVAAWPAALRPNSGSTVPHDQVLPASMVPLAVNVARFQRWIFPLPAVVASVLAHVASMMM